MQRCEGGLDSLAQCEVLSPLQELVGQASLLHDSQRRALLRLQEARARNNVADLARRKLWNLDGRIEAGAALYVALQGARNSAQCRAVARRARQRAEAAILHARQQLSEVQAAQEGRDRCLASLQQARLGLGLGLGAAASPRYSRRRARPIPNPHPKPSSSPSPYPYPYP